MEARESSTETARTDAVYGVSWMDGVLCSTWMSPIVTRGGGGGWGRWDDRGWEV